MSASPRALGFDPGTVSTDLCALENGRLAHAASVPTAHLARALLEAEAAGGILDQLFWPPARAGTERFVASLA